MNQKIDSQESKKIEKHGIENRGLGKNDGSLSRFLEVATSKKVVNQITDYGHPTGAWTVTAYQCGRGYLIISNAKEELHITYTNDRSDTTDELLSTHAISDDLSVTDYLIERVRWDLDAAEKRQVDRDYSDPCVIVSVGNYYGHTPVDLVDNGETSEPQVFDNAAAAYQWIEEADKEPYYCGHNEAGRPAYYVWADHTQ